MMWPNDPNSSSSVRKKSKLSLSLRSLKESVSSNDSSTCILSNQVLHPNQVTSKSVDVEPDDNLDDFKSPMKFDTSPKKVKRKDVKPYRHPGDTTCTQEILVDAYKKAKENDIDYRSEDEFVIFQKYKQRKEEKQILGKSCSGDEEKEKSDSELKNSEEDKFAKPVLPLITMEQTNKIDKKCNINKSFRSELKNIKINDVIIADSEDEVIPCSQKVVRAKSLKNVNGYNVKAEALSRMENKSADSKSFIRTGIFWSGNFSIRLLYSEQETDKGTVFYIPKQDCVPIPVSVSDQDPTNILKIENCKALKDKVLNEDNISVNSKSNQNQPENDLFSNLESSMNLHNVHGSNMICKYVDSALEQSNAKTNESNKLQIDEKISQLGWDELQMTEAILDLQPSQSNVSEFKKISKGLRKSKVPQNVTTKALKSSSRGVLTPKKCRSKKLQCTYFRKLWWRSKNLKRKYRRSKAGTTRSGVKFRI